MAFRCLFSLLLLCVGLASFSCGQGAATNGTQPSDDDLSPTDDDDLSPPDDDNDDASPDDDSPTDDDASPEFCADGYLTLAGDCLTQIAGGDPGHNGISVAVAPDGGIFVAAARGREFVIFSHASGAAKDDWQEEIVGRMAGNPVIAFGPDGKLHAAFFDLWNEVIRYGVKSEGGWAVEDVESIGGDYSNTYFGPYLDLAVDETGQPHLSYQTRLPKQIRYARREAGGWVLQTPLVQENTGSETNIAVDGMGSVHLVFRAGGNLGIPLVYYATNQTGYWQSELIESWAYGSALDLTADGTVHLAYAKLLTVNGEALLKYRHGSFGAWQTENVFLLPFLDGLQAVALGLDDSHQPHIFYGTIRLGDWERLEHAAKDGDEWRLDVLASAPARATISYQYAAAYPLENGEPSVVSWSPDYGLIIYGSAPEYEATCLGQDDATLYGYQQAPDGGEFYFYGLGEDRLVLQQIDANHDVFDIFSPDHRAYDGAIAVDSISEVHLYYEEEDVDGQYYHWYLHKRESLWINERVPFDENTYFYPDMAVDAAFMPHFIFAKHGVLQDLRLLDNTWSVEILAENIGDYPGVFVDANANIHVVFFDTEISALRYAIKRPNLRWMFRTIADELDDVPSYVNIAADTEAMAVVCRRSHDGHELFVYVEQPEGWEVGQLFVQYLQRAFHGCGLGKAVDKVAVVSSTEQDGMLLAVNEDGDWTERVLDENGGSRFKGLYWDEQGTLRFGYAAQGALQQATVRTNK